MKRFFKGIMALALALVTILSVSVFPVSACEVEETDPAAITVANTETGVSPQALQYTNFNVTVRSGQCSATFRVRVGVRDDPDFTSGLSIVDVDDSSIQFMYSSNWSNVTNYRIDRYTIGRTAQSATLYISLAATPNDGTSHSYTGLTATINL